jgi:Leucine-rich repeat (LRR) protein
MKDLKKLTLGEMQISDLTFMSNLGRLTEINVSTMPVSSVASLRGISSLQSISLFRTNVVDISPLLELPQLKKLSVQSSPARSDVLTELERRGVSVEK